MKKTVKALVAGLALAGTVAWAGNPPPTIKADAPNRYVVKKGDTLWGISGKYLKAPQRWREIWAVNKQLKNPHLIYPGDILIMCLIKGKTLVGVDTGEGCAGIEHQMNVAPSEPITINSYENSVPAIPLSIIRPWLTHSVVVSPVDFENTPYVLASKEGNLITSVGNKIYAKGAPLIVGQRYGIYRKGEPYIDQRTSHTIALEVEQVASAVVTGVTNGISSLEIKNTYGSEVREGDRIFIEVDAPMPSVFYPAPATITRGGLIARVMNSIHSASKNGVVAINLGANDGIQPGHVLDVYKKGKLVRDAHDHNVPVRLPSELVGQVMVFKAFNQISYAYVLSSEVPLTVGDQLVPSSDY